jgi:N-acetyl-gamma-glutamyl-phosphate reductase
MQTNPIQSSPRDSFPSQVRVGVVGGNGYTGRELLALLGRHPGVEVVFATSRGDAGLPSPCPGVRFTPPDEEEAREVEVLFLCLPHGTAADWVERIPEGPRIVDLTADHRPGSGREAGAVFGLNEWNRPEVVEARLVANPGCYPTGVLLSLLPLLEAEVVDPHRLTVVNAASGVTGAGRAPRRDLLFAEVSGNFKAYGWGNRHRHLKEMRALMGSRLQILFQPHLLPLPRGILETIVLPVLPGVDAGRIREIWSSRYRDEPVVRILADGLPELASVVGTDRLDLGAVEAEETGAPVVLVGAALDNLGKGAAGQAIQNLNAMQGWPTELGLRL